MNQVRKYLIEFGFLEEDIDTILLTPSICSMTEATLLNHCIENNSFFLKNGYMKEEVIKMTKVLPALYSYSIDNIKQKIDDMILLGYTKEEVIKMTKVLPALYSYSIDNIKQKIDDMVLLGYTKEEVIKMTKVLPPLYSLSINNIKQKIEYFREINLEFIS